MQCNRHASFISYARSFHNSFLELTAVCVEGTAEVHMFYEIRDCDSQVIRWKIASEVNEIDRIGSESKVEKAGYQSDYKEERGKGERSFKEMC